MEEIRLAEKNQIIKERKKEIHPGHPGQCILPHGTQRKNTGLWQFYRSTYNQERVKLSIILSYAIGFFSVLLQMCAMDRSLR